MEEEWIPKTKIGKMVKEGKINSIDEILDKGMPIKEAEIVDYLLPNLESNFIFIGQLKGKFGGGRRRIYKVTRKKTAEGDKPKFSVMAVVGNRNGYVGIGMGSGRETVPAREKAIRNAKLNIIRIKRGCGSWECWCGNPHSIPMEVSGRCSSTRIILKPAPKGVGLVIGDEGKKILELAGIKDVWSRSFGQTRSRINYAYAIMDALRKLSLLKIPPSFQRKAGVVTGEIK